MIGLPRPFGGWRAIYCDPPWSFETRTPDGQGRSPSQHYDVMDMDALRAMPVASIAAHDSALFMWATFPMLPEALSLMAAWGFTYRTGGAWAKQSSTGRKWAFGTGYIFRGAAELLIVGARGEPSWLSRSERNLWAAPVREHSRKPECVAEAIVRLTPEPRLEMFARQPRAGFTVWGNQTDRFAADAA